MTDGDMHLSRRPRDPPVPPSPHPPLPPTPRTSPRMSCCLYRSKDPGSFLSFGGERNRIEPPAQTSSVCHSACLVALLPCRLAALSPGRLSASALFFYISSLLVFFFLICTYFCWPILLCEADGSALGREGGVLFLSLSISDGCYHTQPKPVVTLFYYFQSVTGKTQQNTQ